METSHKFVLKMLTGISLAVLLFTFSVNSTAQGTYNSPVEFVSYYFENGSPLFWEYNPDGSVLVKILYDHERATPNRASNHWHFQVHAKTGSDVAVILELFPEVWNGNLVPIAPNVKNLYVSADGKNWKLIPAERMETPALKFNLHMDAPKMFVSGMEPYRISDLDRLLSEIRNNPLVKIQDIGKTVEGRNLEIVQVGKESAPYSIFIRARAHPWEAGGNWVVQGLIKSLLEKNKNEPAYLDRYCVYILPMANKDGVARGMTRFNCNGRDINRGQNIPADPVISPENFAQEKWLKMMSDKGIKPNVSIDLHNDRNGHLGFGRAPETNGEDYLSNTMKFESLMYKYTWYTWTEKGVRKDATNSANYTAPRKNADISCTLELNQTWIAGLNKEPFGKDWELMGRQLRDVFYNYFDDQQVTTQADQKTPKKKTKNK